MTQPWEMNYQAIHDLLMLKHNVNTLFFIGKLLMHWVGS